MPIGEEGILEDARVHRRFRAAIITG